MHRIQFGLDFTLNEEGLKRARREINSLATQLKENRFNIDTSTLDGLEGQLRKVDEAMSKAFDHDLKKLDISKFNKQLKGSEVSLTNLQKGLRDAGVSGVEASKVFSSMHGELLKAGKQASKTKTAIGNMADTIARTARWSVASATINQFSGSIQQAIGYTKNLDESLNNIRVVTGKSQEEMRGFADQANRTAGILGKSTREYVDASLLFFQQGKEQAEVAELTRATLIGANINNTDAADMANLLTAALNGFNKESEYAMTMVDKLAAVGATTAASYEEVAKAFSKVSSMANTVGVDIDQLSAQLSTIISTTREAPEAIGTSLKTVFGRMAELTAGKEDEDGWTTGRVEETLQKAGMSLLDVEGQMRDFGEVIEEIGGKWEGFDRATQLALANALAGQRQANRLMALFSQWELYEDALTTSQHAAGTAMEQNMVRMDSLAYKANQYKVSLEKLWGQIMNEDTLKRGYDFLIGLTEATSKYIETAGGIGPALLDVGAIAMTFFADPLARAMQKAGESAAKLGKRIASIGPQIQNNFKEDGLKGLFKGWREGNEFEEIASAAMQAARQADAETGGTARTAYEEKLVQLKKDQYTIAHELGEVDRQRFDELKNNIIYEMEHAENLREVYEQKAEMVKQEMSNREELANLVDQDLSAQQEGLALELDKVEASVSSLAAKEKGLVVLTNEQVLKEAIKKQAHERTAAEENAVRLAKKAGVINEKGKIDQKKITEFLAEQNNKHGKILAQTSNQLKTVRQTRQEYQNINGELGKMQENSAKRNVSEGRQTDHQNDVKMLTEKANTVKNISGIIKGVGISFQVLRGVSGVIKTFGDESATAAEKSAALDNAAMNLGMTLMMTGHPAGIAAGAIVMIGRAIHKAIEYFDKYNRAVRENTKLMEQNAKVMDDTRRRISDASSVREDYEEFQEIMNEGITIVDDETLERVQTLQNSIGSAVPEMISHYDAHGNAVIKLNEDLDDFIDKQKEVQREMSAAMLSGSGNFATQYSVELEDANKKIEQNLADIAKGKKTIEYEDHHGNQKSVEQDFTSESLAKAQAEILAQQEIIKETKELINMNMVQPIFSASEAFDELSDSSKRFATGLINLDRFTDAFIADPGRAENYAEQTEAIMQGMLKRQNSEYAESLVQAIADIEKQVSEALMEENPNESYIAQLTEEAEELNAELQSFIDGPLAQLSSLEIDNVMSLGSFFDVDESKMDKFLEIITAASTEVEKLAQFMSDGNLNFLTEELALHGIKTEVSEIYEESKDMMEDLQKRRANGENHNKAAAVGSVVTGGVPVLGMAIGLAGGRNAAEDSRQYAEMIMLEQLHLKEQKKLEDQYWANIDALLATAEGHNLVLDAYNKSVEETGNMSKVQDDLRDKFIALKAELYGVESGAKDSVIKQELQEIAKYVREFNPELADIILKIDVDSMGALDAINAAQQAIGDLADAQGQMYARMMQNDVAYWEQFQEMNRAQTDYIRLEYGIREDDYATLKEYEDVLSRLSEENKRVDMDETTKAKFMNMSEQDRVAFASAEYQIDISDDMNRTISEMDDEKTANVIRNLLGEKGVAVSVSQQILLHFAAMVDGILFTVREAVNEIIALVNSIPLVDFNLWEGEGWTSGTKFQDKVVDMILLANGIDQFNPTESVFGSGWNYGAPDAHSPDLPSRKEIPDKRGQDRPDKKPSTIDSGKDDKDKKDDKEVADLEWEADIYRDINNQLAIKAALLTRIQQQQKNTYGAGYIKNLESQIDMMNRQVELLERKQKLQLEDIYNTSGRLAQHGVNFNEDGTISNFNAVMEKQRDYVNSLTGEAKEQAKENFQELLKHMERYEQLTVHAIHEVQNTIESTANAKRDLFIEKFEYTIQIKLEANEDRSKIQQFLIDTSRDLEESSENVHRNMEQQSIEMENIAALQQKLKDIQNSTELTDLEKLNLLRKYNEELQQSIRNYYALDDALDQIFVDTMTQLFDKNERHLKQYESLYDESQMFLQVLELTGQDTQNPQMVKDLYAQMVDINMDQVRFLNSEKAVLEQSKQILEQSGMKGSEQWQLLDDKIREVDGRIRTLATDTLGLLRDQMTFTINNIIDQLDRDLTGGMGIDGVQREIQRDRADQRFFMDDESKLLKVSQLRLRVERQIAATQDPRRRALLQSFIDEELEALREKDQLSYYELERAEKVYDLTLKQMALEDLQAAKHTMMLSRDDAGNWVYEFVEDMEQTVELQDQITEAIMDIREFDKQHLQESLDYMMQIHRDYLDDLRRINLDYQEGRIESEAEYQAQMEEATRVYNERMKAANEMREIAIRNYSAATVAAFVDDYRRQGTALRGLTQEQQAALIKLARDTQKTFLEVNRAVMRLIEGGPNSLTGLFMKMENRWVGAMIHMIDMIDAGDGVGGFSNIVQNAIDEMISAWEEYSSALRQVQQETKTSVDDMNRSMQEARREMEALRQEGELLIQSFHRLATNISQTVASVENIRRRYADAANSARGWAYEIQRVINLMRELSSLPPANPTINVRTNHIGTPYGSSGGGVGYAAPRNVSRPSNNNNRNTAPRNTGSAPRRPTPRPQQRQPFQLPASNVRPTGGNNAFGGGGGGTRSGKDGIVMRTLDFILGTRKAHAPRMRTGGYTGSWNRSSSPDESLDGSGRWAILHEKELVLNKEDTKNMLDAINIVRQLQKGEMFGDVLRGLGMAADSLATAMKRASESTPHHNDSSTIEQEINIEADFSGVQNSQEIEKAFENLSVIAAQHATKYR